MTTTNEGVVCWSVSPLLFFFGCLLGCAGLVYAPSLYRKLRYGKKHLCKLCCYFTDCAWRKPPVSQTRKRQAVQKVRYYTEIDETTIPQNIRKNTDETIPTYEDFAENTNEHRYSDIEPAERKYEDVTPPTDDTNKCEPDKQPIYYVLEPNTYKRLPVRLYTESVVQNENNVYFKLEPGSNNVKPTFETPSSTSEHTYFILEPGNLSQESVSIEAYAVSVLGDDHACYTLEKVV